MPNTATFSLISIRASFASVGVRRIVAATAFAAMPSIFGAMPAAAHTEEYYTPQLCQATDLNGIPSSQIRFLATAVNWHDSNTYYLKCPVPYVRNTNNLSVVRVRLRAIDRHSQKSVVLRICETRDSDGVVTCAAQGQSGIAFDGGLTVVEAVFTPSAATRWLSLDIFVPDRDSQTGLSSVIGYRVCRGSC